MTAGERGAANAPGGVARATAVLGAGRVASAGATGLSFAVLAAAVGTSDFGTLTTVLSAAAIATALGDSGLVTAALRRGAAGDQDNHDLLGVLMLARLLVSLLAGVVLLSAVLLITGTARLPVQLVLAALAQVVLSAGAGSYLLLGQLSLRPARWATADLLGRVVGCAGVLVAAAEHSAAQAVAATALGFALSWGTASRLLNTRLLPSRDVRRACALLRESVFLSVATALNTIYFRLDVLLLAALLSRQEVGQYGFAYRVFELFLLGSGTLQGNLVVSLRASPGLVARLRSTWSGVTELLAPLVLLSMAGAPSVVSLVGGRAYAGSGGALVLLLPAVLLVSLNSVTGAGFIALHMERRALSLNMIALGANLVLNLALIPLAGIRGSALATTLSELLVLLLVIVGYARRLLGTPFRLELARRGLLRTAVCGAVSLLLLVGPAGTARLAVLAAVATAVLVDVLWQRRITGAG